MTSEQLKNLSLIDRLREERESGLRNSIYDYTQTQMSYHTNAIEGSKLTLKQTVDIYDADRFKIFIKINWNISDWTYKNKNW